MDANPEQLSLDKAPKGDIDTVNHLSPLEDVANGIEENGLCHNPQPSCFSDEKSSSGAGTKTDDDGATVVANGELSPSSLRRSTRICALKAAERIKLKESIIPMVENFATNSNDGYMSGDPDADEPERPPKKRRLAARYWMDQFDCKFGVKVVDDEVLLMSDDSVISSLNDEEIEHVKRVYEKSLRDMTEEQLRERELMTKTIEEELRLEEAKLSMLKMVKKSQKVTVSQLQEANVRKLTANIAQNGSGTAYKPPVATPPQGRATTGHGSHGKGAASAKVSAQTQNIATAFMNLSPQQQAIIQNAAKSGLLNSATAQMLLQAQQQQSQANGRLSTQQQQQLAALAAQQHQSRSSGISSATATVRESPAQKAAAAKLQLRRELEQHLLRIPPPRPPPPDMHFIPNANQPDFCALLGLDIAVQRLLKDKNATSSSGESEEPYVCEECGTDFTPTWRAIGTSENDLHLYCEACVKAAQKRKMRQEHTALLRKEFERVLEKEQELEKQIADGKYDNPPAPAPSTSTPRTRTPAATPPPGSHAKTPTGSTPHTSTLKTSASTSALPAHHHHTPSSSHKSTSHKRPAATPASTASASTSSTTSIQNAAAAAAIAAAASGANNASFLQQQMANAAALRHMNPVLAAMMANPLLSAPNMLQWPGALMQQRGGIGNLAMAALLNAAQNAQQSNAGAAAANSLAALAAMNPAAAAAMLTNPQMMRQIQQAQQLQKNFLLEYAKQARK